MLLAATAPAAATPEDRPPSGPPSTAEEIAAVVDQMSIDELIGQMTWTHVYGNSADDDSVAASNRARYGVDTPAEVVQKYDLRGALYFSWSNPVVSDDPVGTAELSNGLQAASTGAEGSGIPLAVTIDQEGGIVARMGEPATVLPGNMALGATFDSDLAHAQGEQRGCERRVVGSCVGCAPALDAHTSPGNPGIGARSRGGDPDLGARLGVQQIKGMQAAGIPATAKHFPGHGETAAASHTGLPSVR